MMQQGLVARVPPLCVTGQKRYLARPAPLSGNTNVDELTFRSHAAAETTANGEKTMAYSAATLFPNTKPATAADWRTTVATALARIVCKYRVYRTTRILSALDDSVLHDIGLDRTRILWAARHAALVAGHRTAR
ncbi:DUF1127 domain-containing protein [Pelagibius sp. 7325]|uniref:DUF1127 domain-containing protein n=1 Tax=Pelagibius sp. 7325 TaxID=3131994 RepID=UPI0030ED27FB